MASKDTQGFNDEPIVYTWLGAPAKVLMPNSKWMYLIGEDPVSKDDYKKTCAARLKRTGKTSSSNPVAEKPNAPAPTRINFWKSGGASFYVEGVRVPLEEFIAHHVSVYESGKEVEIGETRFCVSRISPKYSTYSVNGVLGNKPAFIAALSAALFPNQVQTFMEAES